VLLLPQPGQDFLLLADLAHGLTWPFTTTAGVLKTPYLAILMILLTFSMSAAMPTLVTVPRTSFSIFWQLMQPGLNNFNHVSVGPIIQQKRTSKMFIIYIIILEETTSMITV
jgi:hypothetical protein